MEGRNLWKALKVTHLFQAINFALILQSPKLHTAFNSDIIGFYVATIRDTMYCLEFILAIFS